jgi:hypothetical protein
LIDKESLDTDELLAVLRRSKDTRAVLQNQCDLVRVVCSDIKSHCDKRMHGDQTEILPYEAGSVEMDLFEWSYNFHHDPLILELAFMNPLLQKQLVCDGRIFLAVHLLIQPQQKPPLKAIVQIVVANSLTGLDISEPLDVHHKKLLHHSEHRYGFPSRHLIKKLNLAIDLFFDCAEETTLNIRIVQTPQEPQSNLQFYTNPNGNQSIISCSA